MLKKIVKNALKVKRELKRSTIPLLISNLLNKIGSLEKKKYEILKSQKIPIMYKTIAIKVIARKSEK